MIVYTDENNVISGYVIISNREREQEIAKETENAHVVDDFQFENPIHYYVYEPTTNTIRLRDDWQEIDKAEKQARFEQYKQDLVWGINRKAKEYIFSFLKSSDWGDTYEECLAELNSSAQVTETKILYLFKSHKPSLTLTEVRKKIAEYLAGTYTVEDAVKEMQEAGLAEEEIQKYLSLLGYAVEVAKLLYWIEEVWDYVEQKEKEIEQATSVEELEQIEIKFPELR